MSKKERRSGKKKFKKRYIVIPLIIVLFGAVVISNMMAPEPLVSVSTEKATRENIEATLDISGLIQSGETINYYAEVSAVVSECNVSEGQQVHSEDLLLSYDTSELESQYKQAELEAKASEYSYQQNIQKSKESAADKTEAQNQVNTLKEQIQAKKDEIQSLQNQFAQGDDIGQSNTQLTQAQSKLAELESNLSRQESLVETADAGILSDIQIKQLDATNQISQLSMTNARERLEKAQKGVTAAFDGIITDVQISKGAYGTQGAPLFSLKNIKKMVLEVSLSKYDLEKVTIDQTAEVIFAGKKYTGTVSKIESSAKISQTSADNAPYVKMQIRINEPDDKLVIGMEGKANILLARKESVITVPVEAVNTDKEGDFCYVLSDKGTVERRPVTVGISSNDKTEIIEGINEGEKIITNTTSDVTEGAKVIEKE